MGIKCSLLGHSFTETRVEEEREEQGSEVVITVKEVETCERCGAEQVVSENKEVTSIETESADAAGEDAQDDASAAGPSPSTGTSPAPDMDAVEDDAELIGDEPTAADDAESSAGRESAPGTDAGSHPAVESAEAGGAPGDDEPTAADDDAVILDDGDDGPARDPGEWPDEADDGPEADEEDATAVEWPDDGRGDDGDEWEASESLTRKIDEAEVERAGTATVTVPEGTFECPECGFTTSVESTSLRAGDFCPECHRGSLEHHPEDETRKG